MLFVCFLSGIKVRTLLACYCPILLHPNVQEMDSEHPLEAVGNKLEADVLTRAKKNDEGRAK